MILVDTGPLVAVGARDDRYHQVCTDLLASATEELLVPATVSAEVCYLEETRGRRFRHPSVPSNWLEPLCVPTRGREPHAGRVPEGRTKTASHDLAGDNQRRRVGQSVPLPCRGRPAWPDGTVRRATRAARSRSWPTPAHPDRRPSPGQSRWVQGTPSARLSHDGSSRDSAAAA